MANAQDAKPITHIILMYLFYPAFLAASSGALWYDGKYMLRFGAKEM